MDHTHFFVYNIPAYNTYSGMPDKTINVIATWDGSTVYGNSIPMAIIQPVNVSFFDMMKVKDWRAAYQDIKQIAESHFKSLRERMLSTEMLKELSAHENPVLSRYHAV